MVSKMVSAVLMGCCMFAALSAVAQGAAAAAEVTAPTFAVTALPGLATATLVDSCVSFGSVNYTANGTAWTRTAMGGGFDLMLECAVNTNLTKVVANWPVPGQVSYYLGDGGSNFVLLPYSGQVLGPVYLGGMSVAQGTFTKVTSTGGAFKTVTAVTREMAAGGLAPTTPPASATATFESPFGAIYNFWAVAA